MISEEIKGNFSICTDVTIRSSDPLEKDEELSVVIFDNKNKVFSISRNGELEGSAHEALIVCETLLHYLPLETTLNTVVGVLRALQELEQGAE